MTVSLALFGQVMEECFRPAIREQLRSTPTLLNLLRPSPKPAEEPEFWTWLCDITTPDRLDDDEYDW